MYWGTGLGGYQQDDITSLEDLPNPIKRTEAGQTYEDYARNSIYGIDSCPCLGVIKPLVIPVWFKDSTSFISQSKKEAVREDIRKAYFGSEKETGWHSVRSFYEKESDGRLDLDGVVSNWYEINSSYKNYFSLDDGSTEKLVEKAVDWYFTTTGESRRDYDADGNGFIDGVFLIYAAADYFAMDDDRAENLWAYCSWLGDETKRNALLPGPNTFFWASYDFMYGNNLAETRTGKRFYGGDTRYCSVDAHTYIHEMGHVLGLDDYYDYGENSYSPAGAFSMQDYNVGGHDPYSLFALGYADPYIPKESCEISLRPFQLNHDLLLLTPDWNEYDSPFDEYLLLELYTPAGLNRFDSEHYYMNQYPHGPNAAGIRVWHVDGRLIHVDTIKDDAIVVKGDPFTSNVFYNCKYGVATAFNNSYQSEDFPCLLGETYESYNLLHLIRNSKSAKLLNENALSSQDLFKDGSKFDMNSFASQFPRGSKLNSGKSLNWSFSVSIEGSGSNTVAKISLTKQ